MQSNRWERRVLRKGEARAVLMYQPSSYTLYLVSLTDGSIRPLALSEDIGSLSAVGRDGFLYFLLHRHSADGEVQTQVTKAALR